MTTRGKPAYDRPVTPLDPSLTANPVPQIRHFPVQSYGPGTSADILSTVRSISDLDAEANPSPYRNPLDYHRDHDEVRKLIAEIASHETVIWHEDQSLDRNPTWGFYVFVTSYSSRARELLPAAIETILSATQRNLSLHTLPPYTHEAIKRFKLDVVTDETALSNASDDRVRAEFRAQILGLNLTDEDEYVSVPPARHTTCLVLDEPSIVHLAGLVFPDNPAEDYTALGNTTVKVLDGVWVRPGSSNGSDYRGVGMCRLVSLARLYLLVSADPYEMEDSFPLHGLKLDI